MQLRGCKNGNTFYHRDLGSTRLICSLNEYVVCRLLRFIPLIPDLKRPLSAGDVGGGWGLVSRCSHGGIGGAQGLLQLLSVTTGSCTGGQCELRQQHLPASEQLGRAAVKLNRHGAGFGRSGALCSASQIQ